nr:sulfatase-like hydrolase/transferase [Marivivens donghaensis]
MLIADDHRFETLGVSGCEGIATPHLDALAAGGAHFMRAHCQGGMHPAVCSPSRASLLTGRNIFAASQDPGGLHFGGKAFAIPEDMQTMPQLLRQAGYRTHAIGKWHNDRASFARSFSSASKVMFGGMSDHDRVPLHDFDPTGEYSENNAVIGEGFSTDLFREAAHEFLCEAANDQPFFMQVAFTAPHDPRTPPLEVAVSPKAVTLPANFAPAHSFDNGEMLVRDELLEAVPRDPEAVRQHIADYYGMVQHLDHAIGKIIDTLNETGQRENTVVIYTADHGIALGQHGLMGKQNLYQHSVQVPLMINGRGFKPTVREDLVWHADTAATILDIAGVPSEYAADGTSLIGPTHTEHLFGVHGISQRSVRTERWKYIAYLPNPEPVMGPSANGRTSRGCFAEQLFDLDSDPCEMANLIAQQDLRNVRSDLIESLFAWQRSVNDPLAERTREFLKGAGE